MSLGDKGTPKSTVGILRGSLNRNNKLIHVRVILRVVACTPQGPGAITEVVEGIITGEPSHRHHTEEHYWCVLPYQTTSTRKITVDETVI